MFSRLARALLRHRVPVLVALALLTLAALATLPWLSFNFTPQDIFKGDDELQAFNEQLKEIFPPEENLLLVVLQAPEGADVATPEALRWQLEATEALARVPHAQRAQSVATVGVPREDPRQPGTLETSPLIKQGDTVDEALAQRAREALGRAELLRGALISRDLRLAVVLVRLDPGADEISQVDEAIEGVWRWLEGHAPPEGYQVFLQGVPQMRHVIVDSLRREQMTMLPTTGLVFMLLLGFLFRRPSGVFPPLIAVGVGVAWTVGAMVLLGQHINIINNILVTLLFVVGISDGVHIITRYAEEHRRSPEEPAQALVRTIEHLGLACLLTSSTTAVGFASLVVARTELLRSFGWQAALGAMLTYLATLLILGTSLSFLRPPQRAALNSAGREGLIERLVDRLAKVVVRRAWLTVGLSLVLMAGALWVARGVKVDAYLIEAFQPDHPEVQHMRVVERDLGGFLPLEVSLKAQPEEAFRDPALFARVHQLQRFLEAQPEVLMTRSYVDLHQEMRVALLGDPAQRAVLPTPDEEGRRQIYQIQELIDAGGDALGFDSLMQSGFSHARVRVRIRDAGSRATLALAQRTQAEMARLFPPGGGVEARLAGGGYVAASGLDSFIRDLFASLLAAVVVIFLMMGLLFRSVRVGLITILPNVAPLVLLVGYMGLRGYDLNTTNVILFSISLGLAVNDTIHFLTRFREEVAQEPDVAIAVRRAFLGSGRAIVLTTVLLVVGMAVIFQSDFLPSRRFAELTMLTLSGALVGDLMLLPACLVLFWKPKAV